MLLVTAGGFGTVMLPKPMYTMDFPSARAFAIQSSSEVGGVQPRSGLSRNQLLRASVTLKEIESNLCVLSRYEHCVVPIKRFGDNTLQTNSHEMGSLFPGKRDLQVKNCR